jgi:hypothetical protein
MNYSILDLDRGINSREMDTNSFPGDTGVGMATRLSGISKVQQVNKQATLLINTTNDFDIAQQQQPPSRQCKSTILFTIQFNHHERPIPTKASYTRPSGGKNNRHRSQNHQDRDCGFEGQSYSNCTYEQAKDPSR